MTILEEEGVVEGVEAEGEEVEGAEAEEEID